MINETFTSLEDLDLHEEEETINKLNETLIDLQNIRDEMVKEAGVNKTLAVALEQVHPGFLNDDYPLESFTASFSKTNLKPTLESAAAAAAIVIGVLVGVTIKYLVKLLKWLFKLVREDRKKAKRAQEIGTGLFKIVEATDKTVGTLEGATKKKFEEKRTTLVKEADAFLEGNLTLLSSDLINDKLVISVIRKVGQHIDKDIEVVFSKLKKFETLAAKATSTTTTNLELDGALTELTKDTSVLSSVASDIKTLTKAETVITMNQGYTALLNYIKAAKESKANPVLTYDEVMAALLKKKFEFVDPFLPNSDRTSRNIEKLSDEFEKLESTLGKKNVQADLTDVIKDAMRSIKNDIGGIKNYLVVTQTVGDEKGKVVSKIASIARDIYKEANGVANTSEAAEVV
jgi:hypothetical protein